MLDWLRKVWLKLAAGIGGVLLLISVYFVARRTRDGDLNFAAAKREMQLANQQSDRLKEQLRVVQTKQLDIASDIMTEQLALAAKQKADKELDDKAVIDSLRDRGLIR